MEEYYVSGRKASWWLLGTSIVATTFAADTPLAISALVVKQGIWGNWYWWNSALAGMIAVFFMARLWRRSGVLTDTEFIELRYSGRSAAFLRGFRALYLGLPMNCLTIGWVNLAMAKIIVVVLAVDPLHTIHLFGADYQINTKIASVMFCFILTLVYTCLSGLTGVMITDFFQFILAMAGAILLAIVAVREVGGISSLLAKLNNLYPARVHEMTAMLPSRGHSLEGPFGAFLIYILLQWWTVGQTDGGGYAAQRMLAAKNEKHALFGYLWYNIAHYSLRPWPWIITGLCAAVMFPYLPDAAGVFPDPEQGYVRVMVALMPAGLLGFMVATFFAAYMSTIDTQMNWGASYLTNDFYKRFVRREATQQHYVRASIVATILIGIVGAVFTYLLDSIIGAWQLLAQVYAGLGTVYLLRWLWWRINAWSEISAMIASLAGSAVLKVLASDAMKSYLSPHAGSGSGATAFVSWMQWLGTLTFPYTLLVLVPFSTFVWITVTLMTRPVSTEKLSEFYLRVRPMGPGWGRIASAHPAIPASEPMAPQWINYGFGIVAIYGILFGIGKLLLGSAPLGLLCLAIAAACLVILWKRLSAEEWPE